MLKAFLQRSAVIQPCKNLFSRGFSDSQEKYNDMDIEISAKADQKLNLLVKGQMIGEIQVKNHYEANLASLAACELEAIKFYAKSRSYDLKGFEVKELKGTIDHRSKMDSENIPPRFLHVIGLIEVDLDVSNQEFEELRDKAEKTCTIHNLLVASGTKIDIKWVRKE